MSQFLRLEGGVGSLVMPTEISQAATLPPLNRCNSMLQRRLGMGGHLTGGLAFAPRPRQPFSILPLFKALAWGFKPQSPRQAGCISPHASEGVWHSDRELRPVTTAWYVVWANLPHVSLRSDCESVARVSNPHSKGYQLSKLLQSICYGSTPLSGELSPVVCIMGFFVLVTN